MASDIHAAVTALDDILSGPPDELVMWWSIDRAAWPEDLPAEPADALDAAAPVLDQLTRWCRSLPEVRDPVELQRLRVSVWELLDTLDAHVRRFRPTGPSPSRYANWVGIVLMPAAGYLASVLSALEALLGAGHRSAA